LSDLECTDARSSQFSYTGEMAMTSPGVALHLLRGMGFPLHSPESNLALWFNSSLNDLETAMLIERICS